MVAWCSPLHSDRGTRRVGLMCGRFAMDQLVEDLIQEFVADGGDFRDWRPSWNIKPTDTIPIVIETGAAGATPVRRIEPARWSLVPPWSKELPLRFATFNARSETAAEKASFKAAVRSQRALIPARGYYEWHDEGSVKTPYFVSGEAPMVFAGLYSWWVDPVRSADDRGGRLLTATILTMESVPALAGIHDRNPVMLPRDWWDGWLDPGVPGDQAFVDAAVEASRPVADGMRFHQVRPVRGDGPSLIEPI